MNSLAAQVIGHVTATFAAMRAFMLASVLSLVTRSSAVLPLAMYVSQIAFKVHQVLKVANDEQRDAQDAPVSPAASTANRDDSFSATSLNADTSGKCWPMFRSKMSDTSWSLAKSSAEDTRTLKPSAMGKSWLMVCSKAKASCSTGCTMQSNILKSVAFMPSPRIFLLNPLVRALASCNDLFGQQQEARLRT